MPQETIYRKTQLFLHYTTSSIRHLFTKPPKNITPFSSNQTPFYLKPTKSLIWTQRNKINQNSQNVDLRYMHLTGSAVLPMLTLTNFTFMPLHRLMYQYQLAPMTGEVDDAFIGFYNDSADLAFTTTLQEYYHLRFDLRMLLPVKREHYVAMAIDAYGKTSRGMKEARIKNQNALEAELEELNHDREIDAFRHTGFQMFNKVVADILHAKQVGKLPNTGALLSVEIVEKHIDRFNSRKKLMLQTINVALILCKYVQITNHNVVAKNREAIEQHLNDWLKTESVPENITTLSDDEQEQYTRSLLKYLTTKMPELNNVIVMFSDQMGVQSTISDHPITSERTTYSQRFYDTFVWYFPSFGATNRSAKIENAAEPNIQKNAEDVNMAELSTPISFILNNEQYTGYSKFNKQQRSIFFTKMAEKHAAIQEYIETRFNFLAQLLRGNIGQKLPTSFISNADAKQYPIAIFLTSKDRKILRPENSRDEFRTKQDLVLGKNVKYIGVLPENLDDIVNYLHQNNLLDKVSIIDITTLKPFLIYPAAKYGVEAIPRSPDIYRTDFSDSLFSDTYIKRLRNR